ncbi:MAG: hypothetical protein ACI9U5_000873, partial [Colwellia sp.]
GELILTFGRFPMNGMFDIKLINQNLQVYSILIA